MLLDARGYALAAAVLVAQDLLGFDDTVLFVNLRRQRLELVPYRTLVGLVEDPVGLRRSNHRDILTEAPRLQHDLVVRAKKGRHDVPFLLTFWQRVIPLQKRGDLLRRVACL